MAEEFKVSFFNILFFFAFFMAILLIAVGLVARDCQNKNKCEFNTRQKDFMIWAAPITGGVMVVGLALTLGYILLGDAE